ncbi:hypothetical protein OIE66_34005 [Nonomuraea sp. NBC_01738]|uniref:hypothetical protein n=1 Tax=Nonomuraea sp. NBC_01738 TaxID=2976003 RepID=UPI002E119085|nr:hypothetical protein OIE66_34005 [Nonomuraea sp. NBC_01738]
MTLPSPTEESRVDLLRWHLDRYDRLRASTASRASVLLSAGAILSAGNALVLSQLFGETRLATWVLVVLALLLTASVILVVTALIRASGVLVTLRPSRELFPGGSDLPESLLFNGPDTIKIASSFEMFAAAASAQDYAQIKQAALVELWIVIHQHRYRYARLRAAAQVLRWAAIAFVAVVIGLVAANLASAL